MLSFCPAGISTLYRMVVRLRTSLFPCGAKAEVHKLPPMKATLIGSGSSLVKERRAWVWWPLTILMPKISEEGKDVETLTARLAEVEGSSRSSSIGCCILSSEGWLGCWHWGVLTF